MKNFNNLEQEKLCAIEEGRIEYAKEASYKRELQKLALVISTVVLLLPAVVKAQSNPTVKAVTEFIFKPQR